ncbi:MAG: endonuclease/exonuclease/phosphatase family protein [Actinomycetia bacterium]|nr:endonuclease/exonuclease/phosphatase family protein [Actinomycetes bacterium]
MPAGMAIKTPSAAKVTIQEKAGCAELILVAIPALLVGTVSLLAFLGKWIWPLDLATSFRPLYAVGLVAAGTTLLLGKWRRLGWAVVIVGLLNLAFVAPLFWGKQDIPPQSPTMRVISFNVQGQNEQYQQVIDFLRQADADVIFLHEANRLWEEAISEAITEGRFAYHQHRSRPDHLVFSTLTLTRVRPLEVTSHGWAESEARAMEVVVSLGDTEVTLFGIHPLAPTNPRRTSLRDAQFAFVAKWARGSRGPTVVTGDFNATPWSHVFAPLIDAGLRNSQRGYGLAPSFPTNGNFLARVPIDHLLHSPHLAVADRWLGPDLGSDHLPLVVDLALVSSSQITSAG